MEGKAKFNPFLPLLLLSPGLQGQEWALTVAEPGPTQWHAPSVGA